MATTENQPNIDQLKEKIDQVITGYNIQKEVLAEFFDKLGKLNAKDLANAVKSYTGKLGYLGGVLNMVLGTIEDGKKGFVASGLGLLAGVAAGAVVTSGILALGALALGGSAVGGAALAVGATAVVAGNLASYFAGSFIEDLAKDHMKGSAASPPGSNLPDRVKSSSESGGSSGGNESGAGNGDSLQNGNGPTQSSNDQGGSSDKSDRPSERSGGVGSSNDRSSVSNSNSHDYNGGGWGGDSYSGNNPNGGYNGDGFGGDPYAGDAPITGSEGDDNIGQPHNDNFGKGDDGIGVGVPILLDLDQDGIEIIPLNRSTTFLDYNGDGVVGRTAWVGEGDGMLVLDLDQYGFFRPDGKIDHADEFIFSKWARGTRSDMEALRSVFDTNQDGVLSAADRNFSSFRIWIDANANATADPGELKTLLDLGITYIPLTHDNKRQWLADGSRINGTSKTVTTSGQALTVADVVLAIGSQNATMTFFENNANIKLGDGAIYNMYSGAGGRNFAEGLGKKGYEGAVLRQGDGTRLTAFYGANKVLSTLYHQTAAGKLLKFETWTDGQYLEMDFGSEEKLTDLKYVGSAKANTYRSGDETSLLEGKNGEDKLYGGGGKDTLRGGDDSDKLYGESGDDTLFGDDAADHLFGRDGKDTLNGGDGSDKLEGGDGSDLLDGDGGDDVLSGDDGRDTLSGGAGADKLSGDDDDDRLSGESGDDRLEGGKGDDWLDGGSYDDDLLGGSGDDTLIGGEAIDYLYGEAGHDSLDGGNDDDVLSGGDGHDVLDGGNGRDDLDGGNGRDTLYGGVDIDRLNGGADDDTLNGGDGRDTLFGGSGDDVLRGDEGNDSLEGGDDHDSLLGGEGDDTLRGRSGNDELNGGAGDDEADGGDGNDVVYGSTGNDALLGGAGSDRLYGEAGNDHLDGGSDNDTLQDTEGNNTLQGGDGHDLLLSGEGKDYLAGGEGNDTLRSGLGDDQLIGGGGNDTLEGEGGADKLWGGAGADLLMGGAGADVLDGEEGDDRLVGGDGDDKLAGGAGNDTLDGGSGHDQLFGGEGNDILIGGPAVDFIDGGNGIDTIVLSGRRVDYEIKYNAATGRYSIVDLRSGSPDGTDLASIERFSFADGEMLAAQLDYIVGTDLETAWNVENSDTTRTTIGWRASAEDPSKLEAYITHYALNGARQSETVFKPDGSRISTGWDAEGSQAWSSFVQSFDEKARLMREAYQYDNQTQKITEWDHDALGPWWQRETDYDSVDRTLKQVEFNHAKKKSVERVWDYTSAINWSRHTSKFDGGGRAFWQEWLYDNGTRGTLEKDLAEVQEWAEHEQLYEGTTLLMNRYKYDDAHIAKYGAYIITDRWDNGSTNWKEYKLLQDKLERNIWERYIYDTNAQTITQWDYTGNTWSSLETRYNPQGMAVWQKEAYRKQAYILRQWDDAGADWTKLEYHYNEDGKQTFQENRYDNGTRQVWRWNYDGEEWANQWEQYDFKGTLENKKIVYDDGSYTLWKWTIDYSLQDVFSHIEIFKYNSDNKLYYEYKKEFSIYEYIWETDYEGATWNKRYTLIDLGKKVEEDIRYDDKSRKKTQWDPYDSDPWEKLVTQWDTDGRKESETANWDDETVRKTEWDDTRGIDWERRETHTRAGEKLYQDIIYDTNVRIRKKYDPFNEHEWKDYYQEWNASGALVREWYIHDVNGVVVVVGSYNGLKAGGNLAPLKDGRAEGLAGDDAVTTISTSDDETFDSSVHSDAFVFGKRFGHDVVVDFQTGNDVLMFAQSVFKDWNKVITSAKQSGSDVIITADKDNSLVLKNVMLANLSADDFRFVA